MVGVSMHNVGISRTHHSVGLYVKIRQRGPSRFPGGTGVKLKKSNTEISKEKDHPLLEFHWCAQSAGLR